MRVAVYDTTLRDGAQGEGVNFSLHDKLLIAKQLAGAGVDFIEGGYPLSNPKDAEFFRAVRDLDLGATEVAAFGMTRKKGGDAATDTGLQALLAAETRVVTIVGKSSTFHVTDVLGATLAENVAMIADSVKHCRAAGRRVVYDAEHFFDGYTLDADYALATLKAAAAAGAEVVCLCDTNGGALPERVADVVAHVRRELGGVQLGIHCHNDGELAVANTLAAVRAGAAQVQGTINGVGERCGNADLVTVVGNLALKYGYELLAPGSVARLTDLSRFVYEVANLPPRHSQAFVGASAFAHKGGMHTHAVAKDPTSYEHVDPTLVGNDRRILVSELSGRATILAKTGGAKSLNPDALVKVLAEVQDREYAGYEYEAAEASFDLLVRRAAGRYTPWFERLASRVHLEYGPAGQVTEAAVKLRVNGAVEHTVAEGDGPVNALDAAARKALLPHYPRLAELELMDYKVRVVNARAGTAARVRVVIESHDKGGAWGTVGVSTDVVEASWLALADAIEHKLFRDSEGGGVVMAADIEADDAGTKARTSFDPRVAQEKWLAFWDERGFFRADPARPGPAYSIVIPPPNVTGALHMGHALNGTLQDVLVRWRRAQGYNAVWVPGTDHAGIATQAVVEKQILQAEGKTRHDLGRDELVARIWAWKGRFEARILGQLKQIGASCDWSRTAFTLDEPRTRAVREAFFRMFRDGYIFRGKRLVNWDVKLQTSVADDETETIDTPGGFWTCKYPVVGLENEFIRFSTTRPETMLGDTAVCVHPSDERYKHLHGKKVLQPHTGREIPVITDALLADPTLGTGCVKVTPAHDPNDYACWTRHPEIGVINVLNPDGTINANGGEYAGVDRLAARDAVIAKMDELGLFEGRENRVIPLKYSDRSKTPIEPLLSDQWFVRMGDTDAGKPGLAQLAMDAVTSGRVKFTPERYTKTYLDWLGEKRDWCVSRQLWWGHRIPVWTSRPQRDIENCQITVNRLRAKPAIAAALATGKAHIQIVVDAEGSTPYQVVVDNKYTGAVSTVPTGFVYVCFLEDDDQIISELVELKFEQDPDVLDTWFSSALWPFATMGWPNTTDDLTRYYPTSTLVTSRDIITLWVARMVLAGVYNLGDVPFRDVYITPKVMDGYGVGMSKSLGNGVDPLEIIERYGADALRYYVVSIAGDTQDSRLPVANVCPHCDTLVPLKKENTDADEKKRPKKVTCPSCKQPFRPGGPWLTEDTTLPTAKQASERFEQGRNFANKLWNASRFLLQNLDGYTAAPLVFAELATEDRWIVSRLATTTREVTAALEKYRFAEVARLVYEFAWTEFCDWYLEMSKARLKDPATRPAAQRVLVGVLDGLVRLVHPVMPFVAESVWHELNAAAPERGLDAVRTGENSVCIAPWPAFAPGAEDADTEARVGRMQDLVRGVREVRNRYMLDKTPLELAVKCSPAVAAELDALAPFVKLLGGVKALACGPDVQKPRLAAGVVRADFEGYVSLAGLIDPAAEAARTEKQIADATRQVAGMTGKLSNAGYVTKADPEVVAETRQKVRDLEAQIAALTANLADLRAG